jgi:hypothetical protein
MEVQPKEQSMSTTTFRPATERQLAFLKTLVAERVREDDTISQTVVADARAKAMAGRFSSTEASTLIEALKALPKAEQGEQASDPEPGVYVLSDRLYHVKVSEKSAKAYAMVWDSEGREWEYHGRRPLASLTPEHKITAEQAAEFGHAYGVCVFCTRELTDERSVVVGYGPVCAKHNDLPWGERPAPEEEPLPVTVISEKGVTEGTLDGDTISVPEVPGHYVRCYGGDPDKAFND